MSSIAEIFTTEHADLEQFCSLEGYTVPSPERVRTHAPDAVLMTSREGRLTGRASLWWRRRPDYPGERLGFIGHYAVHDRDSAAGILARSCQALAAQGCTLAVGPIDGSTWRRYRLITERGPEPPSSSNPIIRMTGPDISSRRAFAASPCITPPSTRTTPAVRTGAT